MSVAPDLTVLLLAGRRPGVDPLAAGRGETLKALIPVAGEPMVARVARTLLACPEVARIVVLTQDVAAIAPVLPDDRRIGFATSGSGIATSIVAAIGEGRARWPILVTTADHPLLQVATISAFLDAAGTADVAVGVVGRDVVEARFPLARRTWLRFRGGDWTGANLFRLAGPAALPLVVAWAAVERDRKTGWRLVARFGPVLLARFVTRTITLADAVRRAGRSFGACAIAVPLSDPLAAVDVDKPADLEIAEALLGGAA